MRGADQNPGAKNIEPDFGLCSHFVRLSFPDGDLRPQKVSLEEIGVEGAGLAVETPYPIGLRVALTTEGFAVQATIVACRARETDFYIQVRFAEGYRWSPSDWQPDHFYAPARKSAKGAAGKR